MAQITLNSSGVASNGTLALQSNGTTTAVTIDASQNVGVGTTSPATFSAYTKLSVLNGVALAGDATNGGVVVGANTSGTELTYLSMGRNYNLANAGEIALATTTSKALILGTNGTERMRINAGAPILSLSGGSTSATGTGIAFPATQSASSDANVLDDYEEGTWTPALTNLTINSGTPTYSGTYTKIGRLVFVYWSIGGTRNITVTANSTFINNLPFTSAANVFGGWGKNSTLDVFYGTITASSLLYFTNTLTTAESLTGSVVYTV